MKLWELQNLTPYQADATLDRDRNGLQHWVIAMRAGFEIPPDGGPLRPMETHPQVQLAPCLDDQQRLIAEDDILPFAPVTDVLLRGIIRPLGTGAAVQPFGLRLGSIDKRAELRQPRRLRLVNGRWVEISRDPLCATNLDWRNAFGGSVANGPVFVENPEGRGFGLGFAKDLGEGTEIDLPLICAPGEDPAATPYPAMVGFGPLDRWRGPRAALAGTYDDDWSNRRAPLLPLDFDPAFHLSAPRDQWPTAPLRGGEPVHIWGTGRDEITPFRLPQILVSAKVRFLGRVVPLRLHLCRVDLDATARTVSMLWNGAMLCGSNETAIESASLHIQQQSGVSV